MTGGNVEGQGFLRDQICLMTFKHMKGGKLTLAEAVSAQLGAMAVMISTLPDNQRPVVCKTIIDMLPVKVEERAQQIREIRKAKDDAAGA